MIHNGYGEFFSAIPKKYLQEEVLKYDYPYACDNKGLLKEAIIQHPLAELEIVSCDSSFFTIVSKNDKYINMLRNDYPTLIEEKIIGV